MTLTIDLPHTQTAVLAARAQAQGISAEQCVRHILELALVPEWLQKSWVTAEAAGLDQLTMDEIDEEINSARRLRQVAEPVGHDPGRP